MLRLRRRLAALAALVLLVPSLAFSGDAGACPIGDAASGDHAAVSHHATGHDAEAPASTHHGPATPSHHHSGGACDMACVPASCAAAGHCATSVACAHDASCALLPATSGRAMASHARTPRSVRIAPEPPPPRA